MKIGVLLTCVDPSAFAARHPDDGAKFAALLAPHRPGWAFQTVPVKDDVFPARLDDYDGYVITGSPKSVHDPDPWIARLMTWIREADAARWPVFGACFGHQAIAHALGGEVGPNPGGWSLGVAETAFEARPWMTPFQPVMRLYTAHKEQVLRLPAGATTVGVSPHCPAASFTIGGHFATTQYHPEMPDEFVAGLIDEMEGAVGAGIAAAARREIEAGAEGAAMGAWICAFLQRSAERRH